MDYARGDELLILALIRSLRFGTTHEAAIPKMPYSTARILASLFGPFSFDDGGLLNLVTLNLWAHVRFITLAPFVFPVAFVAIVHFLYLAHVRLENQPMAAAATV